MITLQAGYPPSANHSRFKSGKLKQSVIDYRRNLGWLYKAAGGTRIAGPVYLEVELYKPAVASPYDVDNALHNILNGLKGVAFEDDDQVSLLVVAKMWPDGRGRIVLRVKKITPARTAGVVAATSSGS
jgi:Holliday junction resolvase RusA-like endonuclease